MNAAAPPAPVLAPLEVEEYLSWLSAERGRAVSTLRAYRRELVAYVAWLTDRRRGLSEVAAPDVEAYVAHLRDSGRAPATVARAMVAVRGLHRFALTEGDAEVDPSADVDMPRVPRGLPKALSEEDIASLLAAVVGEDGRARRDRAIIELLYGTGLRISELVGLDLGDVDLAGRSLRAFGKGSKERIVPLLGETADALAQWLEGPGRGSVTEGKRIRRDDADAVFVNLRGRRLGRQGAWAIVRTYGDRVGLGARLTPHVLRHSCATHMLDHGADIRVVQELLGHASISTTQVYTLVSGERLRQVYESSHPRARRRP